ncbi:unnamed protein product [Callosobruchus maculatus]|uniref:RING-type domain-containing protein n=1 Tax=Callosobruchus maculatus TaxID=64391 RepID=A0A653C3W6_CALMS|nr:unnamed protein product [Callosobruchus maculatus]
MTEALTEKNFSSSQVLQTKCGECKLVCSVAPVSEQAGSFYCGRCRPEGIPNRPFEKAAKKVIFPCVFGCGFHSFGKDALEHEVYCMNRTVVCPFVNCTSTNTLQDLYKHIIGCHRAYVYDQETPKIHHSLHASSKAVGLNCIKVDEFVLLFFVRLYRKADIVNFEYNVCLVWPQNFERLRFHNMQLRLEIEVPQSDSKVIKLIQCKNIGNYYDRSHCVNCLLRSCDKILHEEFNLLLHNIPFHVKGNSEVDVLYTVQECKERAVFVKVPDGLECPVCMDYMTNEIYLCDAGHSFCARCNRFQVKRICPICRHEMNDVRNFTMEELTKQIKVPCRNVLIGCKFVALAADVLQHELLCRHDLYLKPSDFGWS